MVAGATETGSISTRRACALAFVAAAATLFVQILVHRMVSAKLLNNYAFLVISLTMLGFALSGVVLTFRLKHVLERLEDSLTAFAILFALSFIGATTVFYGAKETLEYSANDRPAYVLALIQSLPLALLYTVPFLFLGLILGTLLGSPELPARTIYCFDLVGSSVGALLVIPAIRSIGVERAGLLACLAMLLVTCLLLPPRGFLVQAGAFVSAVLVLLTFTQIDSVFALRYPEGSTLSAMDGRSVEHIVWDPVARVEVTRIPPPDPNKHTFPCLIGDDPQFLQKFRLIITQNNYAFTYAVKYDGNPNELRGIEQTIYAAAYETSSVAHPRVLVIGVGGGFDILNALYFNAAQVTGVEVNGAIVNLLSNTYHDYFKAWVDDPRVHLVNAEGRNFLARSPDRYDVIQLSGVDSYSGTPGAANVFSENYLYTAEAFDLYLSRLADNGIVNVMRLEYLPRPAHMLRALATAVASLRRRGVERPWEHISVLTAKTGNFTALLVKRTPFTDAEIKHLQQWVAASRYFDLTAGRGHTSRSFSEYDIFLRLRDGLLEQGYVASYPWDIRPTEDDWPFFFRASYWWHLFPTDPQVWAKIPILEYSLLILFGLVSTVSLVCICVPLWFAAAPVLSRGAMWRYALFSAAIGVGYLAIEIALLQKFGLFLGHPNYALSVVLTALLMATGIGSLLSAHLVKSLGNIRFVAYALAVLILAQWAFAFPRLPDLIYLGFAFRTAIVAVLVAPIGLLLGVFFPTVLEAVKQDAPTFAPWAWGINGIFSVVSPIVSIGFSMTWGINALFIAAIPAYLLAALLLPHRERADVPTFSTERP
jgi:spermidine synthase